MTTTDYIIDLALIAVIFIQVRPRRLTTRSAAVALVLVGLAAVNYLRPVSLTGNDLGLIVILALCGAVLGMASGLATRTWRSPDGQVMSQTGWIGAGIWIAGMGFRFWFAYYATHSGASAVAAFSIQHAITSGQAWTTAFVIMAFAQVIARVAVLQARRVRLLGARADGHSAQAPVGSRVG